MTSYECHKFHTLDAMRGVAALAVVFFHFRQMLFGSHHWYVSEASGYLAVDLFFALSGFVIAFAYDDRLAAGMSFRQFAIQRLIRLLPMIWIGVALGVIALAVIRGWRTLPAVMYGLANAFLIPTPLHGSRFFPTNSPEWSLFYEVLINFIFAAFWSFLTPSKLRLLIITAGAVLVVCALKYGRLYEGWTVNRFHLGLARVTFSFFLGVVLHRTRTFWKAYIPTLRTWLLLTIVTLALLIPVPPSLRSIYDLSFVTLLSPLLVMLGSSTEPRRGLQLALFAGFLSYPVYACHRPFEQFAHGIADSYSLADAGAAVCAIVILLPAVCAIAIWYDKPVRKLLTRRFNAVGASAI